MNAAASEADDHLSFPVVRSGDREDFAERWPVLAKVVGDDFFRRHSENPDIRNSTPCLFCLLDPAGKAVSSIHGYADTLTVRGTDYPWIWTGALQTVPELQGRGLASLIVDVFVILRPSLVLSSSVGRLLLSVGKWDNIADG